MTNQKRIKLVNWSMLLPSIALLFFVFGLPLIKKIQLSLTDAKFIEKADFIALENYVKLLTREDFYNALRVMLIYTVCYTIGIFVVGFATSLLLEHNPLRRGKSFFRTMYVLSYAVPDIVTALIFTWIFNYNYGVVNYFLAQIGIIQAPINWLNSSEQALYTIVLIEIWRQFPLHTLVIYAGFQEVPGELYESAEIDGAGGLRKFFSITIPHLSQILSTLLILTIIWSFRRFAMIWSLTKGGPSGATETVVIQIYKNAFVDNKMGLACATGVVMLIITLLIVRLYMKVIKRSSE